MMEQPYHGHVVTVTRKIDHMARLAAAIFALQGWTYDDRPCGGAYVPGQEELASTMRQLLNYLNKGISTRTGTGRLEVSWNSDFRRYEVMLHLGDLSERELYEETGLDIRREESSA